MSAAVSRASVLSAVVLVALACAGTAAPGVERLRLSEAPGGWSERKNSFLAFDGNSLFEIIDGAAPEYIEHGLLNGFRQELERKSGGAAEVFVEDLGDSVRAAGMYAGKRAGLSGTTSVPGLDSTAACAFPGVGGVSVYAWHGRYYIEMVLTGIADLDVALARAAELLVQYRGKVAAK